MKTFLDNFTEEPLINFSVVGLFASAAVGLFFLIYVVAYPAMSIELFDALTWAYNLVYFFSFAIIVTEILFLVESWQRKKDKNKLTFGGVLHIKIACLFTAIVYYPYFAFARFVLSKFGMELLAFVGVVGAFFIWVGINYLINKSIQGKKGK